MQNEPRIDLNDTAVSAIKKLSEGNPGAATVCLALFQNSAAIDPDATLGPLAHLLALDTLEIYGTRIWMLYKDACKQDLTKMIAVLRAVQLGKLAPEKMDYAIDNRGKGLDLEDILKTVQAELPAFGKNSN